MLLALDNPKATVTNVVGVYAMYTWLGIRKEPQADLLKVWTRLNGVDDNDAQTTINEVQSKPDIVLHGHSAKLHSIYLEYSNDSTICTQGT